MKLFRQQAIDHQHRLHGEVFLVSPLPWRMIAALLLALALVATATLAFGTSSRSVVGSGLLRAEGEQWLVVLSMPAGARARLRAGQPAHLALIADPTPGADDLSGTVRHIDGTGGDRLAVTVRLDPLTPPQRNGGLTLQQGRPVEARILTGRETLFQVLTTSGESEEP